MLVTKVLVVVIILVILAAFFAKETIRLSILVGTFFLRAKHGVLTRKDTIYVPLPKGLYSKVVDYSFKYDEMPNEVIIRAIVNLVGIEKEESK